MVKHIKDEVESKPAMKKIKAWDVISSFVRALLVLYFAETFNLFDTTIFFNYYILIYIIFTPFDNIYIRRLIMIFRFTNFLSQT